MLAPYRLLLAAVVLLTACDDAPQGVGIGRAAVGPQAAVALWPITLTRVYAPTTLPAGAGRFVEMRLGQGADIDLTQTPLYLITHAGFAVLPASTWGQGTRLQLAGEALAPLDLHANAGELAVVDGQLNLHAYAAWGVAPSHWSQSFVTPAQGRGFAVTTPPKSLPYPLDPAIAVNLDPNATQACASADPNIDVASAQGQISCSSGSSNLQLSRVQPLGLDTQAGFVEIYNFGTQAMDLHGLTLCVDQSCGPIEAHNPNGQLGQLPGIVSAATDQNVLAPRPDSARALIAIGQLTTTQEGLSVALTVPALSALSPRSEVALFAPGDDPNTASRTALSYLRLGQTDANDLKLLQTSTASTQVAGWAQQGLNPPRLAGESQTRQVGGTQTDAPSSWALSSSTPGAAVVDPTSPWTSCTTPQFPPAAADVLRIVELAQDTSWRVILKNTGANALDVSGYTLSLGEQTFALTAASLPLGAGATMWIELGPSDGTACSVYQDLCWLGAQNYLRAGALSLSINTVLVGHVQWVADATSSGQAVANGIWPGALCQVPNFAAVPAGTWPYRAVRLFSGASGQSPADYFVGLPSRP